MFQTKHEELFRKVRIFGKSSLKGSKVFHNRKWCEVTKFELLPKREFSQKNVTS